MSNEQIVSLYEGAELTVEELANEFCDGNVTLVKMALIAGSSKYRSLARKSKDETFTDADFEEAKFIMKSCLFAENEAVKYRAAKYIIDDKRGRHDLTVVKDANVNVTLVNLQLQRAMKAVEKGRTIEVEAVEQIAA